MNIPVRPLYPSDLIAEKCTNTSGVPSEGAMKPKPFPESKNFTLPVVLWVDRNTLLTREELLFRLSPALMIDLANIVLDVVEVIAFLEIGRPPLQKSCL